MIEYSKFEQPKTVAPVDRSGMTLNEIHEERIYWTAKEANAKAVYDAVHAEVMVAMTGILDELNARDQVAVNAERARQNCK